MGQVIGRALRRNGLKDTSLIPDLNEWTAEAMELMQMTLTLEHTFETIDSRFHKAKKPCGCAEVYAIEYCGYRLGQNNTVRDPRVPWIPSVSHDVFDAVFVSSTTKENTPSGNFLYTSEFQKVTQMDWHCGEWYKEEGPYILTSFSEGSVTVFFGKVPVDRDGFLMIPNNGPYKEAITWFLLARLDGRGYPTHGYTGAQMDQMFERFAGRAAESITMPSVEKIEATTQQLIQLLPNDNYYYSMFTGRI
jgi:hypothetical protein